MITSEQLQDDFRYLFPDEVACLKRLAKSLPVFPMVINIGAGSGTSGLAFMESRPDLYLATIDIEDKDSPLGSLFSEKAVLKDANLIPSSRYVQFKGDSKQLAADIAAGKLPYFERPNPQVADMVFVDGDHSYLAAKGDILGWLPLIKPGGIMAVHDYKKAEVYRRSNLPAHIPHPMPWPGVDRAVRKFLCPSYEIIEHVDTLIAFRIK